MPNPFSYARFIQYETAEFCNPGECSRHTLVSKPITRIDSSKYKGMYFWSTKDSKSGIRKNRYADSWAVLDKNKNILVSGPIASPSLNSSLISFIYNDETFYIKIRFTEYYMKYRITRHPSFALAAMEVLSKA